MKKQSGTSQVLLLIYLMLLIAGAIGWIENIVKIFHADFSHITGILVLRVVGIFVAPLGSVLGFL